MTKYRIRLKTGRVIGPFVINQLYELKSKGHIQGNEEAQVFPTGDWRAISQFDFYHDLMDDNKTTVVNPSAEVHEDTFLIDLTKLRSMQNEKELNQIDLDHHKDREELTSTVYLGATPSPVPKVEKPVELLEDEDNSELLALDLDKDEGSSSFSSDKTILNPVAQEDIERIRRQKKATRSTS